MVIIETHSITVEGAMPLFSSSQTLVVGGETVSVSARRNPNG